MARAPKPSRPHKQTRNYFQRETYKEADEKGLPPPPIEVVAKAWKVEKQKWIGEGEDAKWKRNGKWKGKRNGKWKGKGKGKSKVQPDGALTNTPQATQVKLPPSPLSVLGGLDGLATVGGPALDQTPPAGPSSAVHALPSPVQVNNALGVEYLPTIGQPSSTAPSFFIDGLTTPGLSSVSPSAPTQLQALPDTYFFSDEDLGLGEAAYDCLDSLQRQTADSRVTDWFDLCYQVMTNEPGPPTSLPTTSTSMHTGSGLMSPGFTLAQDTPVDLAGNPFLNHAPGPEFLEPPEWDIHQGPEIIPQPTFAYPAATVLPNPALAPAPVPTVMEQPNNGAEISWDDISRIFEGDEARIPTLPPAYAQNTALDVTQQVINAVNVDQPKLDGTTGQGRVRSVRVEVWFDTA